MGGYKSSSNMARFCPCFCIYLVGTVPAIWILELDRRDRILSQSESALHTTLSTTGTTQTINSFSMNLTTTAVTTTEDESIISVGGVSIHINLELPPDTWVVVIEQLLLYFMIIGRWMLPRGKISRNELSQLLFVFIGMASDITELFTLFDENPVRKSKTLTFATLTIWTISLIQFCFVLTATKNPNRARVALAEGGKKSKHCSSCCKTELWSILVSLCMQDLPFLCLRTYTLVNFRLITYSIIFFTAKNVLIVLLLWYRIAVICCHKPSNVNGSKDPSQASASSLKTSIPSGIVNREHSVTSTLEHFGNARQHTPVKKSKQMVSYIKEDGESGVSRRTLNYSYPEIPGSRTNADAEISLAQQVMNISGKKENKTSKYLQSHVHQSPQFYKRSKYEQYSSDGNPVFY